jgi:hypothetical protein
MLCRNRVADYQRWREVFDSHASAQREAGMRVLHVWRSVDEPGDVFFLFEIDGIEAVNAFMNQPAASEGRTEAGVIDGEYHFLEPDDR